MFPAAVMDAHLLPTTAPFANLADDDPRRIIGRAVATADSTIRQVPRDRLHDRTPCDGMDVLGLVAHLVPVLERVAVVGRGGDILTVRPHLDGLDLDQLVAAEHLHALLGEIDQRMERDARRGNRGIGGRDRLDPARPHHGSHLGLRRAGEEESGAASQCGAPEREPEAGHGRLSSVI